MTKEEALEFIGQSIKSDVDMAKVADAIKALEREPCDTCGYEEGSIYCKEHCPHEAKIEQEPTEFEEIDFVQEHKKIPVTLDLTPCEDAISRQAVTDTTICEGISCNECSFNTCEDGQAGCLLKERVDKLPSVNPTKTGHWIYKQYGGYTEQGNYHCSECDKIDNNIPLYCPNCGAKMQEVKE